MNINGPSIRVGSPGELLAVMPYLIGHHIAESLVVVAISSGKVVFSARADISSPVIEVARHIRQAVNNFPTGTELLIVGYTENSDDSGILAFAAAISRHRHPVSSVMRVTSGRFFCLSGDGCTPPEGAHISTEPPAVAALVLEGIAPLPSRQAVDDMVAPVDADRASEMMRAFQRAIRRLHRRFRLREAELAVEAALTLSRQGKTLPDDDAAWLCLVLHDLSIRDIAWRRTDTEQWQFQLWLDLTRRCLPAVVAPVATLLAWASYRRGDGTVAAVALNRALGVEPDYGLANLIHSALELAIPPTAFGNWPPDEVDLLRA